MHGEPTLQDIQKEWHGTVKSYILGFSSSFILTIASFTLVITKALSGPFLVYSLIGLAFVQAICQLLFFLHVGQEAKPHWKTFLFFFMVLILFIVVIGSLWIMNDLNARMMPPMTQEMMHD